MGRHSSQVTSEGQTPNLGRARVSRAGFGVSPKQAFLAVGNTIKIRDGEKYVFSARGAISSEPWASPQGIRFPWKGAESAIHPAR